MWYNCLSEYLIKQDYINDVICPCIFIKKTMSKSIKLAIQIDDVSLIRTPKEVQKAIEYLKKIEMKNLGKTTLSWYAN